MLDSKIIDLIDQQVEADVHTGLPLQTIFANDLGENFEAPDEIVQGLITAESASIFYGDSNTGKTYVVIGIGCAVALGLPWFGRQTEQGLVIYLAAESPSSARSRLQAYQQHFNIKVPNFAITQSPIDFYNGEADTDLVIELVKQIESKRGIPVRLIIGDTLARLSAGANENTGQDMSLIVKRIDRIRTETGAHFLLVHHSGKNAAAGSRGWSGIRAAVDTEIQITDSPQGRCIEVTKQRDLATKGNRIGFRLEIVLLGLTKWKAPATSCVAVPSDAPEKPLGKRIGEIEGAVLEFMVMRKHGVKKAEVAAHFESRYDRSNVYRAIKALVNASALHEASGMIAIAGAAK
jgi:hypothetical protein